MLKKFRTSLGLKISFLIVFNIILLSIAMIWFSYEEYELTMYNNYTERGQAFVNSTAYSINTDKLTHYLHSGRKDEQYYEVQRYLRRLVNTNNATALYVFIPDQDGLNYIYNTDIYENAYKLGDHKPWNPEYSYLINNYLTGKRVPPLVMETEYGEVFIVYAPLHNSNGEFVAYLCADYELSTVRAEFHDYLFHIVLIVSIVTTLITCVCMVFLRRMVVKPINKMAEAAEQYVASESTEHPFSHLNFNTNDELEVLQNSLKSMAQKTEEYLKSLDIANRKAETDQLTGLNNKASFEWKVKDALQALDVARQVDAFIMIDFDHFKEVNDTYGHAVGDEALKALADTLKRIFRSSDIIARVGGDEFAVFCLSVGTDLIIVKKIEYLLEKWRQHIFKADGKEFTASLSIGIAFAPEHGTEFLTLYQNADAALYVTKQKGRNGYTIYDESQAKN